MKNSFVMYKMWSPMIASMRPEDAGRLFQAIYAYQETGVMLPESDALYPVFAMIRSQFEQDNQRYEETCKRNRENVGKRWNRNDGIRNDTSVYERIQPNTNHTDSDSDSDSEKPYIKDKTFCSEPLSKTAEPEADVEAIILNTGDEWRPLKSEYEEYVRLYPSLNVEAVFRNIRAWCIANPSKRKTKHGVRRFVNAWLSREQDKGTKNAPLASPKPAAKQNAFNSFSDQHNYDMDALARSLSGTFQFSDTG